METQDGEERGGEVRRLLALTGGLLFAYGFAMTCVFGLMWFKGAVKVCEPILWIRITEITITALLMVVGFWAVFSAHRTR